jgi:hypothetical protein
MAPVYDRTLFQPEGLYEFSAVKQLISRGLGALTFGQLFFLATDFTDAHGFFREHPVPRFGLDNKCEIKLQGHSIVRIAKMLKIYLGLMDHQLTVTIDEPEKIRKRLLGQDSIGIVPEYLSLHRAQNLFDEHVDDVMHLSSFGKAQKEICRLASWKELPCLRPTSAL